MHRSGFLLLVLLLGGAALPRHGAAQVTPPTSVLVGGGVVEQGPGLFRARHIAVRHRLASVDSLFYTDHTYPQRMMLERVELLAEGLLLSSSGRSGCGRELAAECWAGEHLVGAGLAASVPVTPARHRVRLYFVPASAGVYLRARDEGYLQPAAEHGAPTGPFVSEGWRVQPGLGAGIGGGVEARIGGRFVLLDVRPTLVRFRGESAGYIPIGVGIAF